MSPVRRVVLLCTFLALVSVPALFGAGEKGGIGNESSAACDFPTATFVDPTAVALGWPTQSQGNVTLGNDVYVGPFAVLARGQAVKVGMESDVQDNVLVDASAGSIVLGKDTILAHGATVVGPARIGVDGLEKCEGTKENPNDTSCRVFVGFNARVDGGATIQRDAWVGHLARVGEGVTVTSGTKVKPGRWVQSNSELKCRDRVPRKQKCPAEPITDSDRDFMHDVVDVNVQFARAYSELSSSAITGINVNPCTHFNPNSVLPTLGGVQEAVPGFPNRIIGDVRMTDTEGQLEGKMGSGISLRADEGFFFEVGSIADEGANGAPGMEDNVTFHALEYPPEFDLNDPTARLVLGSGGAYGKHIVVHGGPQTVTKTGDGVSIGDWTVFFLSAIPGPTTIGAGSLVQEADFFPVGRHATIGDREVWIHGKKVWCVEWTPWAPEQSKNKCSAPLGPHS